MRNGARRLSGAVVETVAGFMAMEEEWNALAAQSSPMEQFDWVLSAIEALHAADALKIVTVRRDGALVAGAPLARPKGLVPYLSLVGARLYEPNALLAKDQEALEALYTAIGALRCPVVMHRMDARSSEVMTFWSSPALGGLQAASLHPAECLRRLRRRYLASVEVPRLELEADAALEAIRSETSSFPLDGKPQDRLSSSRLSGLRRKRRLAERRGAVTTTFVSPGPEGVDACLDELSAVEATGWKGRRGTALQCDAALLGFYRAFARRAARHGKARFGFLRIGAETAAARLDVEYGNARWELKIGYDERFAEASPGALLTLETLEDAQARGSERMHFLGAFAPWQEAWNAERRTLLTLRWYPPSVAGGAAFAKDIGQRVLGRWQAARARARAAHAATAAVSPSVSTQT